LFVIDLAVCPCSRSPQSCRLWELGFPVALL
jgi:hypothetical protein